MGGLIWLCVGLGPLAGGTTVAWAQDPAPQSSTPQSSTIQTSATLTGSQDFTIPAQPLAQALAAYAHASSVDILYDKGLANGRSSQAVSGRYGAAAALALLLKGTGLSARFTGLRSVVIYPAGARPAPTPQGMEAAPALHLDTAEVRSTPMIGDTAANLATFEAYALDAQAQIRRLLRAEAATGAEFRIVLTVLITPAGKIDAVTLVQGSGSAARDSRIWRTLVDSTLPKPPPGMVRPLEFDIQMTRSVAEH